MNEENDLTERSLFSDSFVLKYQDKREYVQKTRSEFPLKGLKKNKSFVSIILADILSIDMDSILKRKTKYSHNLEEDERNFLLKVFPDSKQSKEYLYYESYGYGMELDLCERCGVHMNYFNSTKYFICKACDKDMKEKTFTSKFLGLSSFNQESNEFID